MKDKIYVVGHKSPDLDSVASAIAYANLKNRLENTQRYQARAAGQLNKETKYVLKKFDFKEIGFLDSAEDKKVILVDHNEFSQAVMGIEKADIVGVLDHHKVNFQYSQPIDFFVRPWGANCTVIAQLYEDHQINIDKELAGLMLSAILVDTVITKSPTCTENDIRWIDELAERTDIEDWREWGMELFKIRSNVKELSPAEIIKSDFKDFNLKAGLFGVGQVETVNLAEFADLEEALLEELDKLREDGGYHTTILFITDILKEGSLFLVSSSEPTLIEKALGKKLVDSKVFLEGVISRKKQVAPMLIKVFDQ